MYAPQPTPTLKSPTLPKGTHATYTTHPTQGYPPGGCGKGMYCGTYVLVCVCNGMYVLWYVCIVVHVYWCVVLWCCGTYILVWCGIVVVCMIVCMYYGVCQWL